MEMEKSISSITSNSGESAYGNSKETSRGSLGGRIVEELKNAPRAVADAAMSVVVSTLEILNGIKNDANALAAFFRGVGYGIMGLQEFNIRVLPKLDSRSAVTVNLIDALQIFADIDYFFNSRWKDDSALTIAGRVVLSIADVVGAAMWMEELGVGLSRAVAAIGQVRYFSFVPLIPLGTITTGFVGVGFLFLGANAAVDLYKMRHVTKAEDPNIQIRRLRCLMDLSAFSLEVIGKVTAIALATSIIPVALPGVVAGLGLAAASFGLLGFAYGIHYRKQLA